jgi:hypothetical protein
MIQESSLLSQDGIWSRHYMLSNDGQQDTTSDQTS